MKSLFAAMGLGLLCACSTVQPDHYYILSPRPPVATGARVAPAAQVILRVSLPSLVDRYEMVLDSGADAITVLEHERWGAPLTDLVTQTLAEDIERRRADLLVTGKAVGSPAAGAMKLTVDIVQVTLRRDGQASIDVHWMIRDARGADDVSGGEVFIAPIGNAPVRAETYAAVARGLSDCLGLLADRLAERMGSAAHP